MNLIYVHIEFNLKKIKLIDDFKLKKINTILKQLSTNLTTLWNQNLSDHLAVQFLFVFLNL